MTLPDFDAIETPRLQIRPVVVSDLPDLLAVNGDPGVVRFLPYAAWKSLHDAEAWLARMQTLESTGGGRQYVAVHRASGRAVGTVLVFRHDVGSARAELGYVLGRAFWGQGLMREALQAFCRRLLSTGAMRRLEAEVHPHNTASRALLLSLGFQLEGRLRQRWVAKGEAYDVDHYGLLAGELRASAGQG